jgi:hypothetical protein
MWRNLYVVAPPHDFPKTFIFYTPELLVFLKAYGVLNKKIAKSLVEVVDQCEMIHRALAMIILLFLQPFLYCEKLYIFFCGL